MISPYISSKKQDEHIVRILNHLGISQSNVTLLVDDHSVVGYKVYGEDRERLDEYKRKYSEWWTGHICG